MKSRNFAPIFVAFTLFLCCADPAIAGTAIFEQWAPGGWSNYVMFGIDTTENISHFAIGNNDATGAYVEYGGDANFLVNPPPGWYGDWDSLVIHKDETGWFYNDYYYTYPEGESPVLNEPRISIPWLDDVAGFNSYTSAFYFFTDDIEYYLPVGYTDGFMGETLALASPFAAMTGEGVVIAGETSHVPIPGAVWLLGSGLIGLIGVRRRQV